MLELIILGEVPGTSIIITFSWAAAALTIFIGCVVLIKAHKSDQAETSTNSSEEQTV